MPFTKGLPTNRAALLDVIAFSEGTSTIPNSDDGYLVIVGSTPKHPHLFDSYEDHPFNRSGAVPVETTYGLSTASGRYQVIRPIFNQYRVRLSLPDFAPKSQDTIALRMLEERGALELIDQGRFQEAVAAASPIWASLPGSRLGQRTQPLSLLVKAYQAAGGTLLPYAA